MTDKNISEHIQEVMMKAFMELQKIVTDHPEEDIDMLEMTQAFLKGIISTAIDLTELKESGASLFLYADIEAYAKRGGLNAIQESRSFFTQYSVSNLDANDFSGAMNYLGQALLLSLYKATHELPLSLRTPDMMLSGIEALLANFLSDKNKVENPHQTLDKFCAYIHFALNTKSEH